MIEMMQVGVMMRMALTNSPPITHVLYGKGRAVVVMNDNAREGGTTGAPPPKIGQMPVRLWDNAVYGLKVDRTFPIELIRWNQYCNIV